MSTLSLEDRIELIKKMRYLIPCTCKICKNKFLDIIIGEDHISKMHQDREKRNVIENLEWDLEKDTKNWNVLKEIEKKRSKILWDLYDDDTLIAAKIPKNLKLGKEEFKLRNIVEGLENLEKSRLDKVVDNLKRRVIKYIENITGGKYLIGEDVVTEAGKRKITKIGNEINEILGLKKAYLLLTNSGLKKKIEQIKLDTEPSSEEEEELESEEDIEDSEEEPEDDMDSED